jgi:hypothetical protein
VNSLLGLFAAGFGFVPHFSEHTRGLLFAVACELVGIGLLIAGGYRLATKSPLTRRYGGYIYYDKNPITYLAMLVFGITFGVALVAAGIYGIVNTFNI